MSKTAVSPDHVHTEKEHDHGHVHGGIFGKNTEIIFAILSGSFLILGFGLRYIEGVSFPIRLSLYLISYFFGAYYISIEAFHTLKKGKFDIDFLMIAAAIGAAILGEWAEGALLLFLFSLSHALEHYAMERARKSITALSELTPPTALVKKGGDWREIDVDELSIDEVILVKPNTKIAADGMVLKGESAVNQASITGESIPVDKRPPAAAMEVTSLDKLPAAHRVFAGTINGSQPLEIRVLRLTADSTVARLVKLVKEAESQKSPTQLFTDKFERVYVPAVLLLVSILTLSFVFTQETFGESFYRAMAVLVAASPCALAISTPSTVLAGVARAARSGVLIKGGRPLENLGNLTAIALDKTGTLTEGRPRLTEVRSFDGTDESTLLRIVVAIEQLSDHPLATAIVEGGLERLGGTTTIPEANDLKALTARGITAIVEGDKIFVGNRRLMLESSGQPVPSGLDEAMSKLEKAGQTAMLVYGADKYLGLIGVMDVARPEAKPTIQKLKQLGIEHIAMLTGDHQLVADAVAGDIGITEPKGSLLPEDKSAYIQSMLDRYGRVAMLGDGVNDAPAMAKSTVGIVMGAAGSDVALETADVALMADRLDRLPFVIGLSRKAHKIIQQNVWISLGMVAILVPLTITGLASIGPAVVGHEGSTLLVVMNALRLLGYKED